MTTSTQTELLPCPFCKTHDFTIYLCPGNGITFYTHPESQCVLDAYEFTDLKAWNTRTPTQSGGEDVVERVAGALEKTIRYTLTIKKDFQTQGASACLSDINFEDMARAALPATPPQAWPEESKAVEVMAEAIKAKELEQLMAIALTLKMPASLMSLIIMKSMLHFPKQPTAPSSN